MLSLVTVGKTHLDIHQVVNTCRPKLRKLCSTLAEERGDIVSLLTLHWCQVASSARAHLDRFPVSTSVPVRVGDLDDLGLDAFLLRQPLLAQLFAFGPLSLLPFAIRQEGRVHVGVLYKAFLRRRRGRFFVVGEGQLCLLLPF